jgi:hypothetical protein
MRRFRGESPLHYAGCAANCDRRDHSIGVPLKLIHWVSDRLATELSAVSESDIDDWWLVTLIVVAFIVAVALLVYLVLQWAAGM